MFKRVTWPDGSTCCWDIYLNGKWYGSKRTLKYAIEHLYYLLERQK